MSIRELKVVLAGVGISVATAGSEKREIQAYVQKHIFDAANLHASRQNVPA